MNNFFKTVIVTGALAIGTSSMALAVFSDMPTQEDYKEAIDYLVEEGFINGYKDNTFKPDKKITRAEFAKVISLIEDYKEVDVSGDMFTDTSDHWANKYIEAAASNHIINGYTDGTFKPNNEITYGEAAAMIIRTLGLEEDLDKSLSYPDNYMALANEVGLFNMVATNDLLAINPARRDNVALMLWNKINYEENLEANPDDEEQLDKEKPSKDIDTKKLYMGVVKATTIRRGELYVTVETLDGEETLKVESGKNYEDNIALEEFIVYTLNKDGDLKLKKILPLDKEAIDASALIVEDFEEGIAVIRAEEGEERELLDLSLDKYRVSDTLELDLEDYTYFLNELIVSNLDEKDESGNYLVKYEFGDFEEVALEKLNLEKGDRLCFDEDTGIALILRGLEPEEEA